MVQKCWRVYGMNGHRQKESFNASYMHNFSKDGKTRVITVNNWDRTGTHDYTEIIIARDTEMECLQEFIGQLSDGVFESCRTGKIVEIF